MAEERFSALEAGGYGGVQCDREARPVTRRDRISFFVPSFITDRNRAGQRVISSLHDLSTVNILLISVWVRRLVAEFYY